MTKEVPPLAAIILAVAAFTGHLSATATSSYQARKLVSMHMSKSLEDRMEGNGAGVEADDEPVDDGTLVSTMQPGEDNESGFEKHMMDKPASAVPRSAPQQNNVSLPANKVTLPDMRLRLVIYYDTTFRKGFKCYSEIEIREVVKETQRIFNLPTKPWTSMELIIVNIYHLKRRIKKSWDRRYHTKKGDAEAYIYLSKVTSASESSGLHFACNDGTYNKAAFVGYTTRDLTALALTRRLSAAIGLSQCQWNQWNECNREDFMKFYKSSITKKGDFCLNKGCKSTGLYCGAATLPYASCDCDQWHYKTYCQGTQGTGRCPCT